MLCTECHVRKGPELAQVGFDLAALFDGCEINLPNINVCTHGYKHLTCIDTSLIFNLT